MTADQTKEMILSYLGGLVKHFTYYDRKNDEDLTEEILDNAIKTGIVSIEEIVKEFEKHLRAVYEQD